MATFVMKAESVRGRPALELLASGLLIRSDPA